MVKVFFDKNDDACEFVYITIIEAIKNENINILSFMSKIMKTFDNDDKCFFINHFVYRGNTERITTDEDHFLMQSIKTNDVSIFKIVFEMLFVTLNIKYFHSVYYMLLKYALKNKSYKICDYLNYVIPFQENTNYSNEWNNLIRYVEFFAEYKKDDDMVNYIKDLKAAILQTKYNAPPDA